MPVALVDPADFARGDVELLRGQRLHLPFAAWFWLRVLLDGSATALAAVLSILAIVASAVFAGLSQVGLELSFRLGDPIPLALELVALAGSVLFGLVGGLLELVDLRLLARLRTSSFSSSSLVISALASANAVFFSSIVFDIFSSRRR